MAVDINGKTVMAYSLYSKEANPLYGDHSTLATAQTLKTYSRYTFDYPYHKAVSVDGQMGMEYPQMAFNPGRPDLPDGGYSDRMKYRMIKVTIHEVGHNFFPMIVNSDERQWTWMDEGLNSFVEILAELDYDPNFPIRRGLPKNIVGYMSGDQSTIAPIMSKGDNDIALVTMLTENLLQQHCTSYERPLWDLNFLITLLKLMLRDGNLNILLLQISLGLWKMPLPWIWIGFGEAGSIPQM